MGGLFVRRLLVSAVSEELFETRTLQLAPYVPDQAELVVRSLLFSYSIKVIKVVVGASGGRHRACKVTAMYSVIVFNGGWFVCT